MPVSKIHGYFVDCYESIIPNYSVNKKRQKTGSLFLNWKGYHFHDDSILMEAREINAWPTKSVSKQTRISGMYCNSRSGNFGEKMLEILLYSWDLWCNPSKRSKRVCYCLWFRTKTAKLSLLLTRTERLKLITGTSWWTTRVNDIKTVFLKKIKIYS